jgi:neural Wiskott-Aldrich syndrome protein
MTDEARLQRWMVAHRDEVSAAAHVRPRTFQCREIVWSTFESMARELEMPIDELVSEAMTAYARARGYAIAEPARDSYEAPRPSGGDPLEETHDAPNVSALDRSYGWKAAPGFQDDDLARTDARDAFVRPGRPVPPLEGPDSRTTPRMKAPPPAVRPTPLPALGAPPPRSSSSRSLASERIPPPPRSSAPGLAPPPPRSVPPPLSTPRESSPPSGARRLVLAYSGESHPVEKERFLLGRSKTQADLRLDDPNVSRQHAVIERVGAAWYIVDLGSTNGVHVAGERVARRALSDGDVIVITTHEIRCSLR